MGEICGLREEQQVKIREKKKKFGRKKAGDKKLLEK